MEQREIELTVISAQDLKNVKSFGGKMSPYAVAWVYPNMKVATSMAPIGGENPTWNANLRLVCEERLVEQGNVVITIDIYNHGSFSNKSIGSATLAVPQNIGGGKSQDSKNGTQPKVMSLPVRRPSARVQGTLNVAVKLGEVIKMPATASWGSSNLATGRGKNEPVIPFPVAGYPAGFSQAGGSNQQFAAAAYPAQYPAQYPPPQYASQQVPYYPPAGVAGGGYMQPPPPPRRSGFGGAGFGTGLLGGALGGLLLGDVLGGGFGGGGCGGGGCGGGGCGGG